MVERWRRWHLRPDPLGYPRHGLVVFMLGLCLTSGLSIVVGQPAAQSLEAALDPVVLRVWGLMLALGAAGALLGMFWQGDVRTGLVAKRFGYTSLCVAASIYGPVILFTVGQGSLLAAGTVMGFAGACGHTAWRVNRRIRVILNVGEVPE